jgi:hypothetical protein
LKKIEEKVLLSSDYETAKQRLQETELVDRDLEGYLKELLGARWNTPQARACLARWKKSKYASGKLF